MTERNDFEYESFPIKGNDYESTLYFSSTDGLWHLIICSSVDECKEYSSKSRGIIEGNLKDYKESLEPTDEYTEKQLEKKRNNSVKKQDYSGLL